VSFKFQLLEADKGLKRLLKAVKDADKYHAKVGYFDKEGGAEDRGGLTNAQLGAIHEFGSGPIPERSHIRATFDTPRYSTQLAKDLTLLAEAVYGGRLSTERAMDILGLKGSNMIKSFVTQGPQVPPPNSAETLRRKEALTRAGAKGAARTLVDTGRMIASITHKVDR